MAVWSTSLICWWNLQKWQPGLQRIHESEAVLAEVTALKFARASFAACWTLLRIGILRLLRLGRIIRLLQLLRKTRALRELQKPPGRNRVGVWKRVFRSVAMRLLRWRKNTRICLPWSIQLVWKSEIQWHTTTSFCWPSWRQLSIVLVKFNAFLKPQVQSWQIQYIVHSHQFRLGWARLECTLLCVCVSETLGVTIWAGCAPLVDGQWRCQWWEL